MKYDHRVKVNGRYYASGEDAPKINDKAVEEEPLPFSESKDNSEEERQYTKTEINKMTTAELQDLAAEEGIENAYDTSGNELKKILAEHFGL